MKRKLKVGSCPVAGCGRSFKNAGGLAAHRRLAKDAAHVAARNGPPEEAPESVPEALPENPKRVEPEGQGEPAPEGGPEAPTAPEPVPEPVVVPHQEAGPTLVAWKAPQVVQALAGDPQREKAEGDDKKPEESQVGEPAQKKKGPTVSDVPLEPFISASVATICNGFFLNPDKGDDKVSSQEVGDTGFPKALEVSVLHYWPDLPLDHPLVLLTVSGAGLAGLVKSKRAPRDKDAEEPEGGVEEAPRRRVHRVRRREPEPEPEPEPEIQRVPQARPHAAGASPEAAMWSEMLAGVQA